MEDGRGAYSGFTGAVLGGRILDILSRYWEDDRSR